MPNYERVFLSGSSFGVPIIIDETTSANAITIHSSLASDTVMDELWVYATNESPLFCDLVLEMSDSTKTITTTLEGYSGLNIILPGIPISGDGSDPYTVKAFASSNTVSVMGYVNRAS
jgi:hypothetical protein